MFPPRIPTGSLRENAQYPRHTLGIRYTTGHFSRHGIDRGTRCQAPYGVLRDAAPISIVVSLPYRLLASIGRKLRPAKMLGMQIAHLLASHYTHQLTAEPKIVRPGISSELETQPDLSRVEVSARGPIAGLRHAMALSIYEIFRSTALHIA